MTIDLHVDCPWIFTKRGESVCTPELMKKGGLDKVVMALYLPDNLQTDLGAVDVMRALHRQIEFCQGRPDKPYLCLEGARLLHQSMSSLEEFARVGIKYLTLTHNTNNFLCDSSMDKPVNHGLSEWGCRVVRACNRLGVLVDVSHCSDKTVEAALKVSDLPIIASHSGCRALVDHPRNLSDLLIKKIADSGGIIGIPFARRFVGPLWHSVFEHITHVAELVGVEHVAIGSDLDGADLCEGAKTAAEWMTVVQYGLTIRGYSEEDIEMISGGNAQRMFNLWTGFVDDKHLEGIPV